MGSRTPTGSPRARAWQHVGVGLLVAGLGAVGWLLAASAAQAGTGTLTEYFCCSSGGMCHVMSGGCNQSQTPVPCPCSQ